VPKGLPEKPGERRLAISVEDHPLDYISFQGTIPEGQYGAGEVKIKDTGRYEPVVWAGDRIEILLHGREFSGKYVLIPFKKAGENQWLILRAKDA
jgi:bifunctional non-homologous end joining protein LigD